MAQINNIEELRLERQRLHLKKEMLEDELKQDFEELKNSIKPLNMIKDIFSGDKSKHLQNDKAPGQFTSIVGSALLDFIISKLVLNKSSYIKKVLASYLVYTAGPSVVQKYWPPTLEKLKSLFKNFIHRHNSQPVYEQSTAGNTYSD